MGLQVKIRMTSRKGRTVENIFVMGNISSEDYWWKGREGREEKGEWWGGDVYDGDTFGGLDYYRTYLSAATLWW